MVLGGARRCRSIALGQRCRDQEQFGEQEQRAAGDLLARRTVKGHGESPGLGICKAWPG
jgi:hypothetical protein